MRIARRSCVALITLAAATMVVSQIQASSTLQAGGMARQSMDCGGIA